MAANAGEAIFRAIADFARLRREAKQAARDLRDTRDAAHETDDALGDVEKRSDNTAKGLDKVGDSAGGANKQLGSLLKSARDWAKVRAKATLGLEARQAKAEIAQIKADLASFQTTRLQLIAETTRVRAELNQVEDHLAELRTRPTTAEVLGEIRDAEEKIARLKAQLATLRNARMRVDADVAGARAKLATVKRDADQIDRSRPTVKVGADTTRLRPMALIFAAIVAAASLLGPAIGIVAALAAGLFAIGAAAAPAVAGLAGVAAMAGAVAQAAGAAKIALSGVGGALKALQTRQGAAGATAASSAKQQQASADAIASAQRNVQRAVEARNRTIVQGDQQVAAAERALATAVESAARRVASAERAYADAVRDSERAQRDLNQARADAVERLEDLELAVASAALDEEAAALRVERARRDLQEAQQAGATGLDLQEADLAYRQAQQSLIEIKERNADLAEEQAHASKTGVEGDEAVIAAHERVADASRGVQDAEAELNQARRDARREVEEAELALGQAIQQRAWANADAQMAVADATRELGRAMRDAGTASEAGAAKIADDFDKASPAAKRFAQFLNDEVIPALHKVRDAVQERALPKFETAIRIALPLLDLFGVKLADTGDILGDLAIQGAQMLTSGPWTTDFGTILDSNNRIIGILGQTTLTWLDGLRHLWVEAGPLAERLAAMTLRGAEAARAFLEAKRETGELSDFMTRAGDVIEQLMRIFGNLFVTLFNVGKAAAPAGQILLDSFEAATRKLREFTGSVEGQNKLRDYFLAIVPAVQETGRLFNELFLAIMRFGDNANLGPMVAQVRTELLPALERLFTVLGDQVVPLLVDFLTNLTNIGAEVGGGYLVGFLGVLNGLATALAIILAIPGLGEFVGLLLTLAGAAAAIGLVGSAIGGISSALTILLPLLQSFIWLFLALLTPVGAVIAAIVGVAVAAYLIITNWDTVKIWLGEFWEWVKGAAQSVWDFLVWLFGGSAVIDKWNALFEGIKAKFGEWAEWGKQKWGEFWDWLLGRTDQGSVSVGDRVNQFGEDVKAKLSEAWDRARQIIGDSWAAITGISEERANFLKGILAGIGAAFGIDLVGAWQRGTDRVKGFFSDIQRGIESLVAFIERQIARAQAALDRLGSSVSTGLSNAARYVIPGYATGGMVGGTGNADNQIIRATAGEWVVPKDATAKYLPFLKAITFGSIRATANIVDPVQQRLLQARLVGLPSLDQLTDLTQSVAGLRGASSTTYGGNTQTSKTVNNITHIHNPIAEPASDSVASRMRSLQLLGAFD